MSDHPHSNPWNDEDLPVLTELALDEQHALDEQTSTTQTPVELTLAEPVYQNISPSPSLDTPNEQANATQPPVELTLTEPVYLDISSSPVPDAPDAQPALDEQVGAAQAPVELVLTEPVYQDISLSTVLDAPQPVPAVETSVTSSSPFPFELLLVSDEQEQAENKINTSDLPPQAHGDALSMIENRLAAMRAGVRTMPAPSLSPSDAPQKPTKQVAVLGETALTEALYQAVLPRVKAEVMVWMQEMLAIQTQQLCEGVLRQFKTDYEVMFGDALRDSLRQAVHEVRRQPLKKG